MDMNRERYLVKSAGGNIDGTRAGLAQFLKLLDQFDEGVIVAPDVSALKNGMFAMVLEEVDPALAKALIQKREHVFSDSKKVSVCTQATLKNFKRSALYLVLWGSSYMIADVETFDRWGAVVLVSWQSPDYAAWAQDFPVTVIYDDGLPDFKI